VRCKTRYCNSTCQHDHWRRSHKQICKRIYRGGNAEQYYADNKYEEAVTVAAEACADDTKGQTCYICTEAFHWKTKEGLVRGCACRGTAGFAHVSCLAEQAKILVAEAEENNLDDKMNERFNRWHTCGLCKQEYHGVVQCALGWACWQTYIHGRPRPVSVLQLASVAVMAWASDAFDASIPAQRRCDSCATRRSPRTPGSTSPAPRPYSATQSEAFAALDQRARRVPHRRISFLRNTGEKIQGRPPRRA